MMQLSLLQLDVAVFVWVYCFEAGFNRIMLGRIMKVKKSSNRVPCFLFLWEEIDY